MMFDTIWMCQSSPESWNMIIKREKNIESCIYEDELERSKDRYVVNEYNWSTIWIKSKLMTGLKTKDHYKNLPLAHIEHGELRIWVLRVRRNCRSFSCCMSFEHSWEEIVHNFHEKDLSRIMEVIGMPTTSTEILQ